MDPILKNINHGQGVLDKPPSPPGSGNVPPIHPPQALLHGSHATSQSAPQFPLSSQQDRQSQQYVPNEPARMISLTWRQSSSLLHTSGWQLSAAGSEAQLHDASLEQSGSVMPVGQYGHDVSGSVQSHPEPTHPHAYSTIIAN